MDPHLARIGSVAAIGGAVTLTLGTVLHPMQADPNDAQAAFAEYAADPFWIASHLAQFAGFSGLGVALVAFAAVMEPDGRASAWARIGTVGTAASVAMAAALQAVDGVALKLAVDRWAAVTGDARALAFEAALAVRQIEIGLASLLSLVFGLTIIAFGLSMLSSRRFPSWLGWLGLAGGVATIGAGTAQAYTGFSTLAMTLGMPASALLLAWSIAAGVRLWHLATPRA